MDGRIFPYPVAKALGTQPAPPGQGVRAIEARHLRAQQVGAEAASHGELEQAVGLDTVGEAHALKDVPFPFPFATPPGAALTF